METIPVNWSVKTGQRLADLKCPHRTRTDIFACNMPANVSGQLLTIGTQNRPMAVAGMRAMRLYKDPCLTPRLTGQRQGHGNLFWQCVL